MVRALRTFLVAVVVAVTPSAGVLLAPPTAPARAGAAPDLGSMPLVDRYAASRRLMTGYPAGDYLFFDARGRGRVVQVFGDLASAPRIVVLVPGMSNRLANFWRGVGGERFRSPAVQAADLWAATSGVAVIAWLGYDAPRTFGEAGRPDLAEAGADALVRFVDDLTALRPDATVAVFGHSYGSTVIGHAASRLPARVTDIAVYGSPGMGVDTVAALGTSARVWAGCSAGDAIRLVPGVRVLGLGHGRHPEDPGFGARPFPTADVSDHDHYLAPGTDSLAALAAIAEGTGEVA
ncbi:alpha/beta hydrolase [Actinoplanes sp. NBRC 101535]|uniref:alpha/beta hydrolase n=1 Tax=Actinoplanes sp. NBRC 101535 TaxID=3032196 RepID=UPI00249FC02D|nr:alpha/beta hydrolase [Actinoplanes sp. NBRC 101535]GLY00213.1 hypothetical protein Acsp01_05920 [Actinoplanes sp. NBRC 101535]